MKKRTVFVLALVWVAAAVCFAAENPNMGTWKLNEAKSKIAPGSQVNTTVVYAAEGDKVKVTLEGKDGSGNPTHIEWTGKFDGKDYPVTGDPNVDMRSYKKVNERTMEITSKKDGKVVGTSKLVVAADGKTRTVTSQSTDDKSKKVTNSFFYDKQ